MKKNFAEAISDETIIKLTDEMLSYENINKNKFKLKFISESIKIISAAAAIVLVIGLINVFFTAPDISSNGGEPDIYNGSPDDNIIQNAGSQANADENNAASYQSIIKSNRIVGDSYTFLVIGRDNAGFNTDTLMLITYKVKDSKISILNIPRDLYINTDKYKGKINGVLICGYIAAYREGKNENEALEQGIRFLEEMIHYTLGIPVDRHIIIDTEGFKFLVDSIGGIDMEVPQDMDYEDPEQNLYIHLKKGWQTLDGDKAEQLVRFRKGYITQDIGRIETQQKFMAALMKKLLKFDWNNIRTLFEVWGKYMTTDMTGDDFGWFALRMLKVKLDNVRVHTIPGEGFMTSSGAAAYSAYKKETIEIINKYYNPYISEIPDSSFNIEQYSGVYYNSADIDINGATMDSLINDQNDHQ